MCEPVGSHPPTVPVNARKCGVSHRRRYTVGGDGAQHETPPPRHSGLDALGLACGTSARPTTPTPAPVAPPPSTAADLSGEWTGTSSDSQGTTIVTFTIAQVGDAVSGTVTTRAPDPSDGSCNACHRNKRGTFTGTLSGGALTMTMMFAAGADGDPTPICSATMTGTAESVATALTGRYTGSDTCEGAFLDGRIAMNRR
jgi:hypothetical protein